MMKLNNKHLVLPYIIGITWLLCHPIISVITGEFKCRGIFTDEHQLDLHNYDTEMYPNLTEIFKTPIHTGRKHNMCSVLDAIVNDEISSSELSKSFTSPTITCHEETSFQVVKIEPSLAPTSPLEALVVVLPKPDTAILESGIHKSILILVSRLVRSPYLAKTMLFVMCDDEVDTCLNSFLVSFGANSPTGGHRNKKQKSFHSIHTFSYAKYFIRQLIVLDVHDSVDYNTSTQSKFRILTQGKKGLLPNLDFVSTALVSMNYYYRYPVQMHPYDLSWWDQHYVPKYFSSERYGSDLGQMGAFMLSAILSPGPHSQALEEGIDSLTIQARLPRQNQAPHLIENEMTSLVRGLEHILRGLNSLQEVLHHNHDQYILPSASKFVSHSEYILPAVLVLLPLALRILLLIIQDIERFQFVKVFSAIGGAMVLSCILLLARSFTNDEVILNSVMFSSYAFALQFMTYTTTKSLEKEERQSLQLLMCLLAIYIHVPLVLAHISLGMLSAIVMVPILAFYSFKNRKGLLAGILLILTLPPVTKNILIMILPRIDSINDLIDVTVLRGINTVSSYSCCIFIPLHFLLAVTCFC